MTYLRSREDESDERGKVLHWPGLSRRSEARTGLKWLRRLGPGVVTGAANVDPSLVVTATVVGAAFKFSLLWLVLLCIPFLLVVFSVSARLGFETRKGLVDLLRENYGRTVALFCAFLVIVINMAMVVADLMAVSDALSILLRQPRAYFVAAVAFSVWYVLIFRDYRKITHALLWFSLPLFVYVAAAAAALPNVGSLVARSFVPRITPTAEYAQGMVAMFGSLLTPYVLVWQTGSRRESAVTGGEVPHGAEPYAGAFVSVLLSYSVVVAAASVLTFAHPVDMTTRQAAQALEPAVGALGPVLFAVGIIGAGMVALPVLVASLCYSISESMSWRAGLSEHPWDAGAFYVLISVTLLVASVANFLPINPVKALYFSQILAGILTVPVVVFITLLANNRKLMKTTNTVWQNAWLAGAVLVLIAVQGLWVVWALG